MYGLLAPSQFVEKRLKVRGSMCIGLVNRESQSAFKTV